MRSEYDFSKAVRGKYAQRFREGTTSSSVAASFKYQHRPKRMDSQA